MASIFKRENKDGTTTWRVMFRRKGLKSFITCFTSEEIANNFVEEHEKEFALTGKTPIIDKLKEKREREFSRKDTNAIS